MKDPILEHYYEVLDMIEAAREHSQSVMQRIREGEPVEQSELEEVESEVQAFLDKLDLKFCTTN